MEDYDVQPNEWERARHWDPTSAKIRDRVHIVIDCLGKLFNDRDPGGVANLIYEPVSEQISVGTIKTPTAIGRFKLEFMVLDADLVGRVIIEREEFDDLDRKRFRAVWAFYVPERGDCFSDPRGNRKRYVLQRDGQKQFENSLFELGLSISYMLIAGPLSVAQKA